MPRAAGALSAAAASSPTSSREFTRSRLTDTTRSTTTPSTRRSLAARQMTGSPIACGRRRRAPDRATSSRRATPTRCGSSTCRCDGGTFAGQQDVERWSRLPRRRTSASSRCSEPGQQVECVYWKGRAHRRDCPSRRCAAAPRQPPPRLGGTRAAWCGDYTARSTRRIPGARSRSSPAHSVDRPGDGRAAGDDDRRLSRLDRGTSPTRGDYLTR